MSGALGKQPSHSLVPLLPPLPPLRAVRPAPLTSLQMTGTQRFPCPIVMEGGSIHVDGQGTLLTTGGQA